MQFPKEIFRAYDIRGLLPEVTPSLAEAVGAALVRKTGARRVVVGRDMRETSPELARAATRGIASAGADVLDIGLCTTPLFYFAVSFSEEAGAGLMVTASHNPPEYNGIKLVDGDGLPIGGEEMYSALSGGEDVASRQASVTSLDVLDRYLDYCLSLVRLPDVTRLKLVIDYGNGMGALTIQPLMKRLGLAPVELYADPDARFPNHQADPVKEETLVDVKNAVRRERADLGIAFDGDADRVAFIDGDGNSLRGDLTLALFAKEILTQHPGGKIAVAPNQSWAVFDAITAAGGVLVETKIGHTNVSRGMRRAGAILGGEISSHFFFEEFHFLESSDFALLLMLKILADSGRPLAELVRPYRTYVNSGEVNLKIQHAPAALAALREAYAKEASVVNELDGIRCEFGKDWWFIARPSNTEPLLRVTVEARDEVLMKKKRDELVAFVNSV